MANDPNDFGPKVTVIVRSFAVSSGAEGLAGVPADEHVERPEFRAGEFPHVIDAWDVRPVFLEDFLVEGIDFDLADDGVAGTLEAEVEPSNAGEETDERHDNTRSVISVGRIGVSGF
ncbi:MAG: hypothetical protein RI554_11390, partial [Trueperaceae bacterium]|nr:hypothetical protein [Trueperaceae bacterium]